MIEELYIDDMQLLGAGAAANYITIANFKGLGNPSPRTNRPPRSRRHGAIELSTYYGPRTFSFDIIIDGDTPGDWVGFWTAFDDLCEIISYGDPDSRKLTFKRAGLSYQEFSYVKVDEDVDPIWPHSGTPICRFPIVCTAVDPRLYVNEVQELNFASTGNVVNGGNFSSPPLIRFNGAGTDPGLRNTTLDTENEINIDYTMIGGDEIEVDCRARTVKLNGVDRPDIFVASTSFFWSLTKGTNALQKLGGAVSIDVEWRDARI